MFNFALKTKIIKGDNPFEGISLNKEVPRDRFLSDDEASNLLNTVIDVPGKHCRQRTLYDLILLGMSLGVRKANLLSMRWDEIDEVNWVWTIPAVNMKAEKAMIIKLSTAEIAVLEGRKQIHKDAAILSPWVFPSSKSRSGHLVDPGKAWDSLRDELKIPDITMHDLRRSLASAMLGVGADTTLVQRALSHSDPRTTAKHYIRTTQQAELEARSKVFDKRLDDLKPALSPEDKKIVPIDARKKGRASTQE
jgi:integrase